MSAPHLDARTQLVAAVIVDAAVAVCNVAAAGVGTGAGTAGAAQNSTSRYQQQPLWKKDRTRTKTRTPSPVYQSSQSKSATHAGNGLSAGDREQAQLREAGVSVGGREQEERAVVSTDQGAVGYLSGWRLRSDSGSDRGPENMSCPAVGAAWGAGFPPARGHGIVRSGLEWD